MDKVTLVYGDITTQKVDAIVNAANKTLLGGGGVDGAIHRAAGPQLQDECRGLGGCKTSEAKITKGYNLPAKFVIHTVGPIYGHEDGREKELLAACYKNSLDLAKQYNIKTIVFPAISTGVYGYPKEEAAKIVYETLKNYLEKDDFFEEIRLVFYSDSDLELYQKFFNNYLQLAAR
jgi:O-acetyl-ADP-ribose deacetylase (regulator of RNase III)